MGSIAAAIKTLIVPAVISLILFCISSFVLIPLWRRYRNRYSQYLPLDTITDQTGSIRQRIHAFFARLFVRPPWRRGRNNAGSGGDTLAAGGDEISDDGFESENGEELADVGHGWGGISQRDRPESGPRLSRDLEEGFRSDSDHENEEPRNYR